MTNDDIPTAQKCCIRNLAHACLTLEQAQAECEALNKSTGGTWGVFVLAHTVPARAKSEAMAAVVARANRAVQGF